MPGAAYNSIQNPRMYEALRQRGFTKRAAARISNARTKDYDAGVGQQIIGNLYRGAGGKFTAGSGGGSLTPAQQRAQNRARERSDYSRAEDALRQREDAAIEAEPNRTKRAALRRQVAAARRQRLYARREQRRQMDEADAQARAQEAAQRNQATAERRAAKERLVAERRRQAAEARAARAQQPKPPKPPKEKKPSKDEQRAANRSRIRQQMANDDAGLSPSGFDALTAFADGGRLDTQMAQGLAGLGMVEGDPPRLTSAGRTALRAIDKGDYRAAVDAVNEGTARAKKRQEADAKKKFNADWAAAERRLRAEEDALVAQTADRMTRAALRRKHAAQRRQRRDDRKAGKPAPPPPPPRKPVDTNKAFAVYKDARGRDRWLAVSSTAYRDRDGEIVSRKALAVAVARGDATGQRGPLRYWHVPGLDLGDCDYQALAHDGRLLVESGTFRRPEYAQALKQRGAGYGVSIGFLHPPTQPDAAGVFDDITVFERSLTPPGRASNPFTSITTKESLMLTTDKAAQLAQLLGGQDSPAYQAAVAQLAETDKAARTQGATFKESDAPPVYELDGAHYTVKEGRLVPLVAVKAEEPEMAAEVEDEDEAPDSIFTPDEIAALADAVAERVAAKLGGAKEVQAEKAAPVAAPAFDPASLLNEITALKAHLARLEGDQPQAAQRASQAPETAVKADDPLLNGYKSVADNPEAVIAGFMQGFARPS